MKTRLLHYFKRQGEEASAKVEDIWKTVTFLYFQEEHVGIFESSSLASAVRLAGGFTAEGAASCP